MSRRNQWRPKVTEPTENAITGDSTATNPTPPLEANPSSSAQPEARNEANPPMPEPNLQRQANPTPPPTPEPPNLSDFVSRLTPEQLSRIRTLASAQGIATGPRKTLSGGYLVEIEIPSEACEPLETWAQEAGETFEVFVRKVAADAITNYCFGDWSAVRPAPAATTSTTGAD
jgi:hypothetical protein